MFTIKKYIVVQSLEEAYELNQKKNNVVLGGTAWLKMGERNIQNAIDLSGLGLNKIELERELEEANATGFTDKLMTMVNINTMSPNNAGRPTKDDTDLTDSGAKTRSNASNIEKGGKV